MFPLDYKSRLPIYEQLNKSISKMAALGALEPNEQLPSDIRQPKHRPEPRKCSIPSLRIPHNKSIIQDT